MKQASHLRVCGFLSFSLRCSLSLWSVINALSLVSAMIPLISFYRIFLFLSSVCCASVVDVRRRTLLGPSRLSLDVVLHVVGDVE